MLPKLIVVVPTRIAMRDLRDSNTFSNLSKNFELYFLCNVFPENHELNEYGNVVEFEESSNFRQIIHNSLHHIINMRTWEPFYGAGGGEFYQNFYKPGSFHKILKLV